MLTFNFAFNMFFSIAISSLLIILAFLSFKKFNKTGNKRFYFLFLGFFTGFFFEVVHSMHSIFNKSDIISNMPTNPEFLYLSLSNFCISVFLLHSILVSDKKNEIQTFRLKKKNILKVILITLTLFLLTEGIFYFNILSVILFIEKLFIFNPLFEILDNSIYVLCLVLLIDERILYKTKIITPLTIGILLLGLFQFYIAYPSYLESVYRIFIHVTKLSGLILLLFGLKEIDLTNKFLGFRKKILTYIICFSISFILLFLILSNIILNISFPYTIQYVFLSIFLLTIFAHLFFSTYLLKPLSNLIFSLSKSDKVNNLDYFYANDEIGLLAEQINEFRSKSWIYTEKLLKKQALIRNTIVSEMKRREIIEHIAGNLEINSLKSSLVYKVSKVFEADRCYIRFFNNDINKFMPVDEFSEYTVSPNIKSFVNVQLEEPNIKRTIATFKENKIIAINNIYEFLEKNQDMTSLNNIKENYGLKSAYFVPVVLNNELIACLSLHYVNDYRVLNIHDINVLRGVSSYLGIAFKNAELYKKIKHQANSETILKKIHSLLDGPIDKEEKIYLFHKELSSIFKVEQVLFVEFNKNSSNPKTLKEYKSDANIMSFNKRPFDKTDF